MDMPDDVHYVDWASHGDIHIVCTDVHTEPAWGQRDDTSLALQGVYQIHGGGWYSFVRDNVNCADCRAWISANPER